jgi:hypothetical protein
MIFVFPQDDQNCSLEDLPADDNIFYVKNKLQLLDQELIIDSLKEIK